MKTVAPLKVLDFGTVYVELESADSVALASTRDEVVRLEKAFSDSTEVIKTITAGVYSAFCSIEEKARPSECSVEFGVKFSSEFGAIVARASGEASLNVTITWDFTNGAEAEHYKNSHR